MFTEKAQILRACVFTEKQEMQIAHRIPNFLALSQLSHYLFPRVRKIPASYTQHVIP